jgi:hypothetical protein
MTTTIEAIDAIYDKLKSGNLISEITGRIYKSGERPFSSNLEDVVINSLPISSDQIQKAIININVYVPNKTINIGGQPNAFIPDTARIRALSRLAVDELDEYFDYGRHFFIQQQTVFEEPTIYQHYINIRVEFYSVNI